VPQPHFEIPLGFIDGANRDFQVSLPYLPNSTAVFRNGQLQTRNWLDGWVESAPGTGWVRLNEAPKVGDVIQIFYNDALATVLGEEVSPLHGRLVTVQEVRACLRPRDVLHGKIECVR